jgi:1-deoxy-D-xylulose-5-phosphate reductoisomerase
MADLTRLEFEEPDTDRFPGITLAYRALKEGGTSGAVMNAANEAAVVAFLSGRIAFPRIVDLTRRAMDTVRVRDARGIEDVMRADSEARAAVEQMI